ncbi:MULTISPECIES: PQQ-binding-like beta-propeller repeat protein [unclassified Nocardioides]|uniref:outer membrane protein assembly factor BamB family protein n=1 Tax=unclassified Nocardioides TaxID=2615069 RepID=UPI0009F08678|nr:MULTISPECIES: PQQ-binding-like beta-propeller repeat protein [unclassified Nocardioides]GAW51052.1 hypothetical protein PD653B2_3388 [Nocardioides sp. PD653-B2]GAW53995.1 hypothetical protein PD653_1402 [Nocardioides sp. PD653]
MRLRENWKPLLAVAVVLLGAGVYVGQDRWRDRCGAAADQLAPDDISTVLRTPDELAGDLADGQDDVLFPVGPELLDTLDALPAPFGDLVAGRVWDDWTDRPSVGDIDDDTIYLASGGGLIGSEYTGSVVAADVTSGNARWGVGVKGYGAGGGVVGDEFVTIGVPEDEAPQVASYDLESGDRQGCTKLGDDTESDPTLGSSTVGDGDIAVAWAAGEGGLVVRRLDPVSGDEVWENDDIDHSSVHVEVDDAGQLVVVSQVASSDPVGEGISGYGDLRGITALDADRGTVAWSWPDAGAADQATAVKVIATDPDAGRVYVLEDSITEDSTKHATAVVALDSDGQEVWRSALRSKYCEGTLWDDAVITSCPGVPLVSLDAATGEQRWETKQSKDLPGDVIRFGSGRSADLGDGTRLVMASDGLLSVDTATGEITPAITEEGLGTFVAGIDLVGDHLVLSTESGVFVLDREPG